MRHPMVKSNIKKLMESSLRVFFMKDRAPYKEFILRKLSVPREVLWF